MINEKRSNKVGYIYIHTSPSGKSYIGQTTLSIDIRWQQHVAAATNNYNQCIALERAIRHHGANNFKHETMLMINENMLDFYEERFIEMHNTLVPNGYNLRAGGNGICTEYMRDNMRKGNDKKLINKAVATPNHLQIKYVIWYHETNKHGTYIDGYRVSDHPNGRDRTFADSNLTIDQKYELAVQYKLFLDDQVNYYDEREKRPKHLGRYKDIGFKVRKPGYKSKWFNSNAEELNYYHACEYLISICQDDEFDDVFKDCEIPY